MKYHDLILALLPYIDVYEVAYALQARGDVELSNLLIEIDMGMDHDDPPVTP